MSEKKGRWMSCLLFKQDRCPNKNIIYKAFILSELKDNGSIHAITLKELNEAEECCNECEDYQDDLNV